MEGFDEQFYQGNNLECCEHVFSATHFSWQIQTIWQVRRTGSVTKEMYQKVN